jgi:hypothetical protein
MVIYIVSKECMYDIEDNKKIQASTFPYEGKLCFCDSEVILAI